MVERLIGGAEIGFITAQSVHVAHVCCGLVSVFLSFSICTLTQQRDTARWEYMTISHFIHPDLCLKSNLNVRQGVSWWSLSLIMSITLFTEVMNYKARLCQRFVSCTDIVTEVAVFSVNIISQCSCSWSGNYSAGGTRGSLSDEIQIKRCHVFWTWCRQGVL